MQELVDRLVAHPLFGEIPRPQLEWLAREGEIVHYASGEVFGVGAVVEHMMVLLQGRLRTYRVQNNQKMELLVMNADTVTGLLPFSRMKASPVDTEVVEPIEVLQLHKSKFRPMMCECPDLTELMVHVLADRVRQFTSFHFQNEKLMALGKLSAGLAHELNNPASAIVRSAGSLREHLASLLQGAEDLSGADLPEGVVNDVAIAVGHALTRKPATLSPLDRSQREDDLTDWLEDIGISDAADLASDFVDGGFCVDDLKPLASQVRDEACHAVIRWVRLAVNSSRSVMQIEEASRRISALIGSVKTYTRLDQVQDKQDVNLNDGIRNTLVILSHKARQNNITINDQLSDGLPGLKGYPGELNQVWTNIIDNALDAMKGGGELTVRSYLGNGVVATEISDTGAGIPDEIKDRIFDPFFTTKEIGQGSGVGLDVVLQIVRHHAGKVDVDSKPGSTTFTVSLPIAD
jgi:signal transduction histidine kinase